MKVLFLKKSYAQYGGEASPRHFDEKSKLSITLDRNSEIF